MVASPSELSLDCKPPQSYSTLLKSINASNNNDNIITDHLQPYKLEEYLSRLEEERLKIDAFKRELPLCMQLLTNAMEASRHQLQSYKATNASATQEKRPILEEFIPIKHPNSELSSDQQKTPNSTSDKANWMTSAQLWSQDNEGATTTKQSIALATSTEFEMGLNPKLSLLDINDNKNNQRKSDGAFLPFAKERSSNHIVVSDLALASDEKEAEDKNCLKNESGFSSENSAMVLNGKGMDTTQTNVAGAARKQRRCWSPDLHRRFVNALQMLGGSQVATPKQIRELMKVDGLTNDEVKSHLQKYRLHTRRPGPNPQQAGAPGPQLVVLGGIWVPPEYATAAAHHHMGGPHTIYSAHPANQVAQHFCPPAIQQGEFYPQPLPQALPQLHHNPNHQIHIFKNSQERQSSPESDGGRDRSESIEYEKSESGSWKGDSGEESNGERKRKKLASLREGEEESNGSEITLKF